MGAFRYWAFAARRSVSARSESCTGRGTFPKLLAKLQDLAARPGDATRAHYVLPPRLITRSSLSETDAHLELVLVVGGALTGDLHVKIIGVLHREAKVDGALCLQDAKISARAHST